VASIKGKLQQGGIAAPHCSPGPAAYSLHDGIGAEADEVWQQRWGSTSRRSNRQQGSNSAEQAARQQQKQQGQQRQGEQHRSMSRSMNYSRTVDAASPRSSSSGINRDSPGPAAYQVNEGLTVRYGGSCKLNSRASPERIFISKLHAESQVRPLLNKQNFDAMPTLLLARLGPIGLKQCPTAASSQTSAGAQQCYMPHAPCQ
jgi:hypothetical protein